MDTKQISFRRHNFLLLVISLLLSFLTANAWAENHDVVFSYTGSNVWKTKTIYKGDTITFKVNGIASWNFLNRYRCYWYEGSTLKDTDTSGLLNGYWDPSYTKTFNSTGTFDIEGDVYKAFGWGSFNYICWHICQVTVIEDTTGPKWSSGSLDLSSSDDTGRYNDDDITKNSSWLTFSWPSATDSGTGMDRYEWKLDSGSWNDRDLNRSVNINAGNGSHWFYVRAVDKAGNPSSTKSLWFKVDTIKPDISSIEYPSVNQHITDTTPKLDWSGGDNSNGSGIWKYRVLLEYDGGTNIKDTETTSSSYQVSSALDRGEGYDWEVWATDIAGNKNSGTGEKRFYVDERTGSVRVDISPASAVSDGAKWQLSGYNSTWRASGTSVTVPEGSYTIKFNSVSLWEKPSEIPINLTESGIVKTGTYKRPDLIVEDVWTVPGTIYQGDSFVIKAKVKNIGDGSAHDYNPAWQANIYTRFYLNGVDKGETATVESGSNHEIPAGETRIYTSAQLTAPASTSMLIKAFVDPQNDVSNEHYENNNNREESATVLVPTGNIWAFLKDQNGNMVDADGSTTPRFRLYTQDGTPVDTKRGYNFEIFNDIEVGGYWIEGYYTGTFLGEEFWTTSYVQVPVNDTIEVDLIRDYPSASDVQFMDAGNSFTTPKQVPVGADIKAYVEVINSRNEAYQCRVLVGTSKTKGEIIDWKHATWQTDDGWRVVPAGTVEGFAVACDTSSTGQRYYVLKVETRLNNGNEPLTDTRDWSQSYVYKVVEEVAGIDITNTNLVAGAQLKITDTIPITWETTGDVGSHVKIEYQNIATDDGWQTLEELPADSGQYDWTPEGLPTGPYYEIRVSSSNDSSVFDDTGGTFGLYTKDYGVTVITHGWQPDFEEGLFFNDDSDIPKWAYYMSIAIMERAGSGSAFRYRPASGNWEWTGGVGEGTPGLNGEIVLLYDWSAESDQNFGNTLGFSEAAGDALFASLISPNFVNPIGSGISAMDGLDIFSEKIHFIGHSRGAVVNSMAIRRIAEYMPTFEVDQVTTLDPHPVKGDDPDDTIYLWKNIIWADNYWREDGIVGNFDGEAVDGASNMKLSEDVLFGDGHGGFAGEHSDVHLFYLGTIDVSKNAFNGDKVVPDHWYQEMGLDRENTGFYQTRLGGGGIPASSSVLDDQKYSTENYPIATLFNGNFGGYFDSLIYFAGWEYHGGEYDAVPGIDPAKLNGQYNRLRHNRLYVPSDVHSLQFKMEVTDRDVLGSRPDVDKLIVYFGDEESYPVYEVYLDEYLDEYKSFLIPTAYKETVQTLSFKIAAGSGGVDSRVYIGECKFIVKPQTPVQNAPANNASIGTLTPLFVWSEFEAGPGAVHSYVEGYQLQVQCITDGNAVVYDTGYIDSVLELKSLHQYSPGGDTGYDPDTGSDRVSQPLEWGKEYRWFVRYRDNYGTWTSWAGDGSNTRKFTVGTIDTNADPELSNGSVTPTADYESANFVYRVHCSDADGDAPSVIRVYVDGIGHGMLLESGSAADGVYYYETDNLSVGVHNYSFSASDPHGGHDTTPTYSGPTVDEWLEPSIDADKTSIDFGNSSQDVDFDVWNDGDLTLDYLVEVDQGAGYFSVSPGSGSSTGTSDRNTHIVHIDRSSILAGQTVTGRVKISDPDADDSPEYIYLSASEPGVVTYTLTTSVSGGGGTISAGGTYNSGQVVTVTATPDADYRVKSWTGTDNDSSTSTSNTVTMTDHKTVTVEFELIPVGSNPVINTITTPSGPKGSYIIIEGTDFGSTSGSIDFGGTTSDKIVSWSDTEIYCRVPDMNMPDSGSDGMVFVTIPAGTFQMGDIFSEGYSDELPVHTVTLSAFYMSKYEITNDQYCQFLNSAYPDQIKVVGGIVYAVSDSSNSYPYCDTHSYSSYSQIDFSAGVFTVRSKSGRSMVDDPMVQVSWYGAKAFCDYYGYRLPTEAQWECAARGGLSGRRFPWGDTINHDHTNYEANGSAYSYDTSPYTTYTYHPNWNDGVHPYTSPVGSFSANGFGLYDVAGNVREWCNDWHSSNYYSSSPQTNPTGPATGNDRVVRGGRWYYDANGCRVANRSTNGGPNDRSYYIGFRVCRDITNPNSMTWVSINDSGAGMKDETGNPISHGGFNGEMSKYETTNAQYCEYLNSAKAAGFITVYNNDVYAVSDTSHSEIYFEIYPESSSYSQISYDGSTFSVRSRDSYDMSNHPVVMVSWYGATAFCNYYGFRLPTEWEWQAVADYDGSYTYGCGTTIDVSKANYHMNNPFVLSSYPFTTPVNHYPSYGYGMNDMAGNVLEWTSSLYLCGGSWVYSNASGCSLSYVLHDDPENANNDVGFRVCRDASYSASVGVQVVRADGVASESKSFTVTQPETIHVDLTNTSGIENGSTAYPFSTIQRGIDAASDGAEVVVADGIYTGDGNRDIDFLSKAITVRSQNGPETCIIDCQGTEAEPHRGFYFHSSENKNSILEGFTITNGNAPNGGGIHCRNTSPTILNCIIRNNIANFGGGVYATGTVPTTDTFGTGHHQFTIDFVTISDPENMPDNTGCGSVGNSYRIGTYEITNDQWDRFCAMAGTPSGAGITEYNYNPYNQVSFYTGLKQPVNNLSWYEAIQFANWLNTTTGHYAAYKFTGTPGTNDYTFTAWEPSDEGYDINNPWRNSKAFYYLPSLDEWYKAAYYLGNGTYSDYSFGTDNPPVIGLDSNYDNYLGTPWDVGSGNEEQNGTYDMMGNISEWGESTFQTYNGVIRRLLCGGWFNNHEGYLRSSWTSGGHSSDPYYELSSRGFRVASYAPEPTPFSLINTIIAENEADESGALMGGYGLIEKCTIINNSSGVAYFTGEIHDSIIWDNNKYQLLNCPEPSHCCVQGNSTGTGNISIDPLFIDPSNDYHLLPDSPCIDAGDPTSPWENEPSPNGARVNIGAYGNTSEATRSRAGLQFAGFNVISKTRVGRTTFRYALSLSLTNLTLSDMTDITVKLIDADDQVVSVTDDEIFFSVIAAESTSNSDSFGDYFTIDVDRLELITAGRLTWQVDYRTSEGLGMQMMSLGLPVALDDSVVGDITGEGVVDIADLIRMADKWLWTGVPGSIEEDVAPEPDGDGIVNLLDFVLLAENWMK